MRVPKRALLGVVLAVVLPPATAAATPTSLEGAMSPAGVWSASDQLDVGWTVVGALPFASAVTVEINSATDGSADGVWSTAHRSSPILTQTGAATIPMNGLEGRRAVRMVAHDQDGMLVRYLGTAMLDRTPPTVRRIAVVDRVTDAATLEVTHDGAGLSPTRLLGTLEIEAPTSGASEGPWIARTVAVGDGTGRIRVDGAGLAEGPHRVRLRLTDEAGNVGVATLPLLWVDRTPPPITDVSVLRSPTPDRPSVQIGYVVNNGMEGLPTGTVARVVDLDRLVTVATAPTGVGSQTIWADVPSGSSARLVIEVTDGAGNTGRSAPIAVTVAGSAAGLPGLTGAGRPIDPRETVLRNARVELSLPGAIDDAARSGRVLTLRVGARVAASGRLRDAAGAPIAGAEVEVWDAAQRTLARAITDAAGRFAVTLRPVRNGPISAGVPVGDGLLPGRPAVPVRLRVQPRVQLDLSHTSARAGGRPVTFTGTISPSPGLLGIGAKNIVLEWRDPLRGTWRPMINSRVGRSGRFRLSWAFGAGGFAVPVRVRLPAEPGWPTQGGLSRTQTIRVK